MDFDKIGILFIRQSLKLVKNYNVIILHIPHLEDIHIIYIFPFLFFLEVIYYTFVLIFFSSYISTV